MISFSSILSNTIERSVFKLCYRKRAAQKSYLQIVSGVRESWPVALEQIGHINSAKFTLLSVLAHNKRVGAGKQMVQLKIKLRPTHYYLFYIVWVLLPAPFVTLFRQSHLMDCFTASSFSAVSYRA